LLGLDQSADFCLRDGGNDGVFANSGNDLAFELASDLDPIRAGFGMPLEVGLDCVTELRSTDRLQLLLA
jgi:hypothetical protein